jgi:hypothetical protein
MRRLNSDDYQGWVAIILASTLFLVALLIGVVAVVDSFTGNNMRSEDIQMTVTIVVALLGTIGAYLGVSAYQGKKDKSEADDADV